MSMQIAASHSAQTGTPDHGFLGAGQCQNLSAVIGDFAPEWSAELHHDELGSGMIVIMTDDDDRYPTLIVGVDGAMFRLEELGWDSFRTVGEYASWSDLLHAVRVRLMLEMPVSRMVH